MPCLQDLERAAAGIFLTTELHKCYLITTDEVAQEICQDWRRCYSVLTGMDEVRARARQDSLGRKNIIVCRQRGHWLCSRREDCACAGTEGEGDAGAGGCEDGLADDHRAPVRVLRYHPCRAAGRRAHLPPPVHRHRPARHHQRGGL